MLGLTAEASNHNVTRGYIMVKTNHTEIQEKFTWCFHTLSASAGKRIRIVAATEQAARELVPQGMVAIFMARLPAMGGAV